MANLLRLAWLLLIFGFYSAKAEEVHIAVSANFLKPIKDIVKTFESNNSHKIILHPGSTGQLYAQIIHGAPYDLFLSADKQRVDALDEQQLTVTSDTYSCGLLAFYSETAQIDSLNDLNKLSMVSLANPELAPYGEAAEAVLSRDENNKNLKKIYGQNIASAYQYALNQAVDGSFVAYSYVYQKPQDKVWLIPSDLYSPIKQNMALLKRSESEAAKDFYQYLLSLEVQSSIEKMGYTSANDC